MDKERQQDRIDAYLMGRASREERLEFEEELTRNHDLSNQTATTRQALAAVELAEDAELKKKLQALESKLQSTPATKTPKEVRQAKTQARVVQMKQQRKGTLNMLGYAAALLLALALGWWLFSTSAEPSPQQLAMTYFEPFDNLTAGNVRGEADERAAAAAFTAYDKGDYAAAATAFQSVEQTPVNKFYYGQSVLAQQKFAEAERVFTELSQLPDFALAPEAAYYRALALLGRGEEEAARVVLREIAASGGHPFQREGEKLLEILD